MGSAGAGTEKPVRSSGLTFHGVSRRTTGRGHSRTRGTRAARLVLFRQRRTVARDRSSEHVTPELGEHLPHLRENIVAIGAAELVHARAIPARLLVVRQDGARTSWLQLRV